MAREPKRLTIGSRSVAVAILQQAISEASQIGDIRLSDESCRHLGEQLVGIAWDVEYKPTAEKLVITISAGIDLPDRMRSTPEDHTTNS